jgi:peptidyl-prolyl cis-trans isomerase A (cyclophilin A)
VLARIALIAAALAMPLAAAPTNRTSKPAATKAQPAPPKLLAQAPLPDLVRVELLTALGPVDLELDHRHAPRTVENFVRYVDGKRFDGTVFYRAMRLKWGTAPNGLIQGGTQNDAKRILPPVIHESTSTTGIGHVAGTISMARYAPGTATGDFSIMVSDQPSLDADPKSTDPEGQAGFAAFGHVTSGMDVVRKIFDSPTSLTKGEGVMRGQMLDPPVRIISARRMP